MKKKGFTLVELLATIVVLSIIALIATPMILNVIEKAKKGALISSVNGLVESANMYYTNEIIKGDISEDVIFDFEEGIQTSTEKLSYKGKVYNGKLILTSDSDVITCIDDGKYYAYKEKDSDEVISGIGTCLYDGTTGDFTIESDVDVIIKECDEERSELQNKIDELTEQISNLQNQINEKDQTLNNLQSNLEANQNEILTLTGEKQLLEDALEEKNKELSELNENLGKVTASASDVLSGKTIYTSVGLVTGTMTNKAGTTTAATTVTESGDNALITIPANGYYSTSSKISVPIETIKNEVTSISNHTFIFSGINTSTQAYETHYPIEYQFYNNEMITVGDDALLTFKKYAKINVSFQYTNSLGNTGNGTTGMHIYKNGVSVFDQITTLTDSIELDVASGDTLQISIRHDVYGGRTNIGVVLYAN